MTDAHNHPRTAPTPRTFKYPGLVALAAELVRDVLLMASGAAVWAGHYFSIGLPVALVAVIPNRLRDYARDQIEPT